MVDVRPGLLLPLLSLRVPEGMHYMQQVLSGKHSVTGTCTKCSGSLVPVIMGVVPAGLLWPPLRLRGPLPPSAGLCGPENAGMNKGWSVSVKFVFKRTQRIPGKIVAQGPPSGHSVVG